MESKYAGMSPYNYSFNNPAIFNDPSGADPHDPPKEGDTKVDSLGQTWKYMEGDWAHKEGELEGVQVVGDKLIQPVDHSLGQYTINPDHIRGLINWQQKNPNSIDLSNFQFKPQATIAKGSPYNAEYQTYLSNQAWLAREMAARRELDPTGHDLAASPGVQGVLDLTLPGYGFTMGGIMIYSGIKTDNKLEIAIGGASVALSGYAVRNTLLAAWKETDILNPSQHINFIRKNLGVGIKRNIAYAEGKIGGETIRVVAVSGESNRSFVTENPINRQYVTQIVDDFSRAFDSEVRILEDFATRYTSTPNVSGRITLVSERPFCMSCSDVIKQFQKQFPNIKINQINGVKQ